MIDTDGVDMLDFLIEDMVTYAEKQYNAALSVVKQKVKAQLHKRQWQ